MHARIIEGQISSEAEEDYRGGLEERLGWAARRLGLRGTKRRRDSNVAVLQRPGQVKRLS